MKILHNKRSLLRGVFLTVVSAVVVAIAYFQLVHRYNYGHFVPYGLHADVLSREVSIGIPGQKKMYWPELSNFSLLPVNLDACDYLTDAFDRGTGYLYTVQRWDNVSNSWQTIFEPSGEDFCRPVPTSTIETDRVSKLLWPGRSVQVMEGEATGARDPFRKDDKARFIVFTKFGKELDWQNAVASEPFVIEDDVVRGDESFRVKH